MWNVQVGPWPDSFGAQKLIGFLAKPKAQTVRAGVVLIHDAFGVSDFIREQAERLAALAAIVLSSKNLTAQAGMGMMYELDAIAMAVIGGVSLQGGRGSIIGTVLGALIFGVIISGFTFLKLDAYYQEMVKGVIIVGAVVLDQWRQKGRVRG